MEQPQEIFGAVEDPTGSFGAVEQKEIKPPEPTQPKTSPSITDVFNEAIDDCTVLPRNATVNECKRFIQPFDVTDASIHRLALRFYNEGIANLKSSLKSIIDNQTFAYLDDIYSVLESAKSFNRRVSRVLSGRRSKVIDPLKIEDIVSEGGGLHNYLSRRRKFLSDDLLDGVDTAGTDSLKLSSYFFEEVKYESGRLSRALDSIRQNYSDRYTDTQIQDINKSISYLEGLGPAGLFNRLKAFLKNYSHPGCKGAVYDATNKTMWYSLQPITMGNGSSDSHTFTGIHVGVDLVALLKSWATYPENAFNIVSTEEWDSDRASYPFFHPHVSETGSLCFGGARDSFRFAMENYELSAGMDVVIGILNTYVYNDAHCRVERFCRWSEDYDEDDDSQEAEWHCDHCGTDIYDSDDMCSDDHGTYCQDCVEWSDVHDYYVHTNSSVWSNVLDTYLDSNLDRYVTKLSKYSIDAEEWVAPELRDMDEYCLLFRNLETGESFNKITLRTTEDAPPQLKSLVTEWVTKDTLNSSEEAPAYLVKISYDFYAWFRGEFTDPGSPYLTCANFSTRTMKYVGVEEDCSMLPTGEYILTIHAEDEDLMKLYEKYIKDNEE